MAVDRLAAFAALALVLIVVPGPSVMFTIARALSAGRRVALLTVLGNAAGELVQAAGVSVGLGVILERSELAFAAVKLLGAAYLAYLGIQAIRGRSLEASPRDSTVGLPDRRAVRDGFFVGLSNPKTTVFFAAALPQFVVASAGAAPVPAQMLVLGAVFAAIAVASDSVWAITASHARSWFAHSPARLGALRTGGGVVMIGLAARLALSSRTD